MGDVTFASWREVVGNSDARDVLETLDDLQHAVARAGAEVPDIDAAVVLQYLKSLEVADRKVDHVDVVTHAGPVHGGIVVTVHREFGHPANGDLRQARQQVVGPAPGVFADHPAFVGANRVEVTQQPDAPAWIGMAQIGEQLFDHELGAAIGVGRFAGADLFGNGYACGFAVHRGR
ncbi:hypothetical protein D3C85_1407250 [compost metagenome]